MAGTHLTTTAIFIPAGPTERKELSVAGGTVYYGNSASETTSGSHGGEVTEGSSLLLETGKWVASASQSRIVLSTPTTRLRTAASANPLVIPHEPIVEVTGTTEIKKITPPVAEPHQVTLKFASTPKVVDGENLKLASDLEATAADTLTLAFDGANYYEVARSVN